MTLNQIPLLMLDQCLFHCSLPMELRNIVHQYVCIQLTDDNIHQAVSEWMTSCWELKTLKYGHISYWDTHRITDMSDLFSTRPLHRVPYINDRMRSRIREFTENINNWDVSNVVNMNSMFHGCYRFNQPLNRWNVSKVESMKYMFSECTVFDQALEEWNVSNVTNMNYMFADAWKFNQTIESWNVCNVKSMRGMFQNTTSFNQSLNKWNVRHVLDMSAIFQYSRGFNQPLNRWKVSNVVDMSYIFDNSKAFNQCLNSWHVNDITNIKCVFLKAKAFRGARTDAIWYRHIKRAQGSKQHNTGAKDCTSYY